MLMVSLDVGERREVEKYRKIILTALFKHHCVLPGRGNIKVSNHKGHAAVIRQQDCHCLP